MEKLVDTIIELNDLNDLNDLNRDFILNKKIGLIVNFNNIKYEFLIKLKASDYLIVIGSGAIPRTSNKNRSKPLFNRHSWDFEESTIYYNDPTLYINNEILVPWGIGDEHEWYLKNISIIIKNIAKTINIKNKNIIFYGSSSGGYTSLMLSVLIKNSIAIADIPQIDCTTFSQWGPITKYCFNGRDSQDIIEEYDYRLKFTSLIKKEEYIPNAFLLLDTSVKPDFERQYIHLFNYLNNLPINNENTIKIIIRSKNKGHTPLNKEETLNIIKKIKKINEDINTYQKLKQENKKLKKKHEELLNSKSWKITKPLRKIVKLIK